jgi:hypothetical protein
MHPAASANGSDAPVIKGPSRETRRLTDWRLAGVSCPCSFSGCIFRSHFDNRDRLCGRFSREYDLAIPARASYPQPVSRTEQGDTVSEIRRQGERWPAQAKKHTPLLKRAD